MTEDRSESSGVARLNLSAQGATAASAGGMAHLNLQAAMATAIATTFPPTVVTLEGTYTDPSFAAQLQAYFDSLSAPQLIGMWLVGVDYLRSTLDDPETSMYAALFMVPFLVLVMRALRNKRGG